MKAAGLGVLILALAFAAQAGTTARTPAAVLARTVPCDEIILRTKFPYVGNSRPRFRYRLVLDVLSVPPAYMEQVVPTHTRPWAYWRKQGLVVRASGQSVTIVVPRAWRTRAGIAWGYGGHGVFSSLRIAGCGSDANVGNAYSGGFYLRSRSACVPLIFRVGTRSATVRFGVGRRCGPSQRVA
jgi:hypothetical protein